MGIRMVGMKILVACEFSQVVTKAFRDRGHEAYSCDLLPTEGNPKWHFQGDVFKIANNPTIGWDMMIAHPPCTYLSSMGVWWNYKRPERWILTYEALSFVKRLWDADIKMVAIENPIGYLSNNWMKPTQIIHPWQHGQEFSKPTCLWTRNLPYILPTSIVGHGEFYTKANGTRMAKWSHITSGTRKEERAKIASRTFQGIADAMAEQWG